MCIFTLCNIGESPKIVAEMKNIAGTTLFRLSCRAWIG